MPFSARLTLDTEIPDLNPHNDAGRYELDPSYYALAVNVGNYTGSVSTGLLSIGLDPSQHTFNVFPPINGSFAITPTIPGLISSIASLTLTDVPGDALTTDAIWGVPFDVAAWNRERHLDFSAFAYDPVNGIRGVVVIRAGRRGAHSPAGTSARLRP